MSRTIAVRSLAAVTPGGGKSLLPVIAAARLIAAGMTERVAWVVPRDSLRLQAEEAFVDPEWREALGHRLSVRAADNEPDPSRGLAGYQVIAAAPELHLAQMRRHNALLVVDEVHHLPGLADYEPGTEIDEPNGRWSKAFPPDATVRGLGKLLVVAPDQAAARVYIDPLRGWTPAEQARRDTRLATSSERDAHESLAAFRLLPEPSILVTVAMAYAGLDAPEVAVVTALTHIRSQPWLEQMISHATRVDPNAGPYEGQHALVFHADDPLFAVFRRWVETEQGTLAKRPKAARHGSLLPDWLLDDQMAIRGPREDGIVPLASNALGLRYATLRPGPSFAEVRPENEQPQTELLDPPSLVERTLRLRIGEMVAAQAVEDDAGASVTRAQGRYHGYNAVLKRVMSGKGRAEMTLAELKAAVAWLERNRLSDHLNQLDGDMSYAWSARQRSRTPVGLRQAARR